MAAKQIKSEFIERRRYPRIKSVNLVDYALFDEKGKRIGEGNGRILNLSQIGTLLETNKAIHGSFVNLMTIDLDYKKVRVKGRVIRTGKHPSSGHYLSGIEFMGPKDEQHETIVAFVKTYQYRKQKAERVH
jgi:c-di-GMP-binding flagellar brake protein YcgR